MNHICLGLAFIALAFGTSGARADALQTQAEAGDVAAQVEMGKRYHDGTVKGAKNSKTIDDEKAEFWWLKAAQGGSAEAKYRLAQLYTFYPSGRVDQARAHSWYLQAAEAGNTEAQTEVGDRYHNGTVNGYPRNAATVDNEKAEYWWLKAAESGSARAQYLLGNLYDGYALGNPAKAKALPLYIQAADQGYAEAIPATCIGLLQEDPEKALPYCLQPVPVTSRYPSRLPEKLTALGLAHIHGWGGLDVDLAKAIDYLTQADAGDEPVATAALGQLYYDGKLVPLDYPRAATQFRKAMALGHAASAWSLARQYADGQGVETDENEANRLRWLAVKVAMAAGPLPQDMKRWHDQHPEINDDWVQARQLVWWTMPPGSWTVSVMRDGAPKEIDAWRYFASRASDFFPTRALYDEVEGRATIHCRWNHQGDLDNCLVLSQTPQGYGFGKATVKLYTQSIPLTQKAEWVRQSLGKFAIIQASWRF